jgi:hypothetical protein
MARKEDRGTFVVGLVERLLPELEEDQREFFCLLWSAAVKEKRLRTGEGIVVLRVVI